MVESDKRLAVRYRNLIDHYRGRIKRHEEYSGLSWNDQIIQSYQDLIDMYENELDRMEVTNG